MSGPKVLPSGLSAAASLYKLQVAAPLPVLNLRTTPSSHFLSRNDNIRLLRWLKSHYAHVNYVQQVGSALMLVVVAAPKEAGRWLAIPSLLCSMLGVCCTFATMSTDVIKILVRHYEFWFFSVMNVLTWSLLAFFLHDLRALSLLPACLAVELGILGDANFRTFVSAIKSTYYLEIPALVLIGALVYLQVADIKSCRLELVPFARVNIALVDVFTNTLAAVIVFAMRRCYNRRHLLQRGNSGCKIVKCVLFRSKLVLRERVELPSRKKPQDSRTRGLVKLLGATSSKLTILSNNRQQLHHQQQISLMPLRLGIIDTHRTLLPSWSVASSSARLVFLYTCGLLGLVLSTISIRLPPPQDGIESATAWETLWYVPIAALVLSVFFCGVFACSYQRDLLRSLLKNFAFLFPSLQFVAACLCLADMMRWDYRCYAIIAICCWFHWVLLLDSLTPPVKQHLLFHKRVATPVIFCLWVSIAAAVYAVVILDAADSQLHERDIFSWRIGYRRTIALNTRGLFLSRITTILIWTFRLFYDIVFSRNDELHFVRGTLDYYCPFDTFPGAAYWPHKRKRVSTAASASAVVVSADKLQGRRKSVRRTSYAESMLISYSSSTKRHASGTLCMLGQNRSTSKLRRNSTVLMVGAAPVLPETMNAVVPMLDPLGTTAQARSAHIRRPSVTILSASQLRDATVVLQ